MDKKLIAIYSILAVVTVILIALVAIKTEQVYTLEENQIIPTKTHHYVCELNNIVEEDLPSMLFNRKYDIYTNEVYYITSSTLTNDVKYNDVSAYEAVKIDLNNQNKEYVDDEANLHLTYKEDVELEDDEDAYVGGFINLLKGYTCKVES